jgi:(p)ppGpp synthase/HD superfamily hydrolase
MTTNAKAFHVRKNSLKTPQIVTLAERRQSLTLPRTTALTTKDLIRAREEVVANFAGITRKVPLMARYVARPYHTHLEAVAAKMHWWGFGIAEEIAALHHDSPEDLRWSLDRLRKEYGSRVAMLVDYVTQQDKSLPWLERQKRYIERLKDAPMEAVALSCADKLANMEDTIVNLKAGYTIESFLKAGTKLQIQKLNELGDLYSERLPARIVGEYYSALRELEKLAKQNAGNN